MTLTAYQSHVISWNITKRCNLACEHCYLESGPIRHRDELAGELSTEECFGVVDSILTVNPQALLILTGGEPFLRPDVFEIAGYASNKGLWVVVGTNGVLISDALLDRAESAGIRGLSLSLDSLDADVHDRFRRVRGAFDNTVNGARLLAARGLPFIVQTTVHRDNIHQLEQLAEMACELGARVFNLYFLVATGRGQFVTDIEPEAYETVLQRLYDMQKSFLGRMMVNSKCAPHYQRVLHQREPESVQSKAFTAGAGGCPAGTHYCGIRPNGDVTPCPYLPEYGGNLRQQSFSEIWHGSTLFNEIRDRSNLGGRCGQCEFAEVCGGCRARAFGAGSGLMAEDPWCVYEPGGAAVPAPFVTYGKPSESNIYWTPAAKERLERIPSFVRGMVVQRVERYAADHGKTMITVEMMHEIRERMGARFGGAPSFLRK
ncbi:MAG: radical SAM protein [Acidobacteria bacterium]|nr:radical SAM protein [Acidobacteriota bacterium]